MTPQILDLNSEVLTEFREKFNTALAALLRNMIEKDLKTGEVGGKIKVELFQKTTEDGEVFWMPEIRPDVHLKVGAKGKLDCSTVSGMVLRTSPCGMPVVASNQISIDDLMEADRKGA